jgi:TRAP-type C4-dicarboxylate transport system permease small subunit
VAGDQGSKDGEGTGGPFGRAMRAMALAAGAVIFGLMVYTVLDVVLRYVFNAPFRGSLEVTQFAMSAIVFLGLAHCGWTGGHVAVDILERSLTHRRLRWVPVLLSLIGAVVFVAIAWYSLQEALATTHRVSNMLRWPHYPFLLLTAFGSAVYALVLLIQAWRALRRAPANG